MSRKSSRWLLAGVLIAVHAGGACGGSTGTLISGGPGVLSVVQLADGRWARGYIAPFKPNNSWNLRPKDGGYMYGNVISESEAQSYLNPPSTVDEDGSDSGEAPPPPGENNPDPDPDPETGCGVDYEC